MKKKIDRSYISLKKPQTPAFFAPSPFFLFHRPPLLSYFQQRQSIKRMSMLLSRNRPISSALQRKLHRHFQRNFSDVPHNTSLPRQFLEAHDDLNFDPSTHQRNDVLFDPVNGKPPIALPNTQSMSVTLDAKDVAELINKDGSGDGSSTSTSSTTYSKDWTRVHEEFWRKNPSDFDCQWEDIAMKNNKGAGHDSEEEKNDATKRVLWSNWTEDMLRDPSISPILFEYDNLRDATSNKSGNNNLCDTQEKRVLKALYQYGLVLITGTPCQTDSLPEEFMNPSLPKNADSKESAESALLHLTSLIGYHPLQTLYGPGVWSTSSKSTFYNEADADGNSASTADSAYGSTSLPLHTDMTYMASPPGVQVFLMVQPATLPDTKSEINSESSSAPVPTGQSVYLDGFAAAQQLRIENSEAFDILASTTRQYRCVDEQEGWHLEASGAAIEALPRGTNIIGADKWGPVKAIRHNDLDRLPDLPPYPDNEDQMVKSSDEFYTQLCKAHEVWDDILRRDSMRLVISLQPGDCVLVSNQRVMHGRYAFDASYYPRVVMGCYVGMDELFSKWRTNGFRVL